MNTYKWDAIQRSLIVTQNPILFSDDLEYEQAIINTGYAPEMSSFEQCGEGGGIRLYRASKPDLPEFYMTLWGINTEIAAFIAVDFLSLLSTMKEIHPLLTCIGLNQNNLAAISKENY